jgi:AraC-like DNA-binding protein
MSEATVAAGILQSLVQYALSRGADERALLSHAQLTREDLADRDSRLPLSTYAMLFESAKRACADPAFAIHWGAAVDLRDMSIVGLIFEASETLYEGFLQINRFDRLVQELELAGSGDRFRLVPRGEELWTEDTRADPNAFPELSEVSFARQSCGARRFLPRPLVLEVHFTHPAPPHRDEYERVLGCPVVFNSHWNAWRGDKTLVHHKLALIPHFAFRTLCDKAEDLMEKLEQSKSARGRVEQRLLPILHKGDVGMEAIARQMGVSRQTLYRSLKAEGVTFEQVLDELRHKMALRYLSSGRTSVNEVSYLVGFSHPAAFSRAFKRWTGLSPRASRGAE